MRLEVKIRKIGNKLGIIFPHSVVTNAGLVDGEVLAINVGGNEMNITKNEYKEVIAPITILNENENIFSRTLSEKELALAK